MTRLSILLLFLYSPVLFLHAEAASDSSSLRAKLGSPSSEPKRRSVIRRQYGPENGAVRKEVRLLEERSQRSQTGFLGDPSHEVPYENHPYDKNRRRNLQSDNVTATDSSTGGGGADAYRPLRIRFETQALDDLRTADNAAKIDFIETEVLPK
jgi:hypothetical protein